jgi:hypothetical protein
MFLRMGWNPPAALIITKEQHTLVLPSLSTKVRTG